MQLLKNALRIALLISLSVWLTSCGGDSGNFGGDDDPIANQTGKPDIKFEVVQFLLSGDEVGTTQDINLSPGFGIPKGAILIRSGTWNGFPSGEANANGSIGFTDGTNQFGTAWQYDPEITPDQKTFSVQWEGTISNRQQSTINWESYKIKESGGFATDKVVIEVVDTDDNPSEHQYEAIMIVIGGDDVESVAVFSHDDLGTGTSPVSVSVGFEPDLFIGSTSHHSTIFDPNGNAPNLNISIGMAINDGSNSQRSVNWAAPHLSGSPAVSTSAIYNNAIFAKLTSGAADYTVALSNFNSDGFDITPSADTSNMIFGGMAIKFKQRPQMALVDTMIATSGNFSETNVGFKGGFGLWVNQSGATAMNTPEQVSHSTGITPFDGINTYSLNWTNEHGIAQDAVSAWAYIASEFSLLVKGGASTIDTASTGDSFTNEGFDFTTTANPPPRKSWVGR